MRTSVARRILCALLAALLLGVALAACSSAEPDESAEADRAPPSDPADTSAGTEGGDEPAAVESPPPEEAGDGAGPDEGQAPAGPLRGTWVHLFDDALKTREGIAALVDELVAADANAVIAQVVRRHDAYYDSDVLPATPDPDLEPGLDVLEVLLGLAHAHDIEVHAWVTVAPTWHDVYEGLDPPEGWLPPAHGQDAPGSQRWVTRTADGHWSEYLDPALPEVRDHVAAVAAELAQRYPVDGVHLDYVRYASERHGYHPDALARYEQETGATGVPDPDDPAWSDWRRAQTRQVVEAAGTALANVGADDVELSAAVITWGPGPGSPEAAGFEDTRAYREALQDWPGWLRDGLVDTVMPMNYFRAHEDDQAAWLEQWEAFQHDLVEGSDARVVPGVGGWLNAAEAVVEQTHRAVGSGLGAVVYSYQQPQDGEGREVWSLLAASGWGAQGEQED